jgi:hypothetical protein
VVCIAFGIGSAVLTGLVSTDERRMHEETCALGVFQRSLCSRDVQGSGSIERRRLDLLFLVQASGRDQQCLPESILFAEREEVGKTLGESM